MREPPPSTSRCYLLIQKAQFAIQRIVCVVLNNSKLGFIALEQQGKGLPEHSIDLLNPDFTKFAEACGGLAKVREFLS